MENIRKSILNKYSSKAKIRLIAVLVGISVFIVTVSVPNNRISSQVIYQNIFPLFAVIFQVIVPAVIIVIYYIKKYIKTKNKLKYTQEEV